jgi:RNA recognition motif-containing protein
MTSVSNSTEHSASLYVGNLDPRMSEPLLSELFAGVGPLLRVKLMGGDKQHASASPKYGFVEFADRKTAELALAAFNGKKIFNNVAFILLAGNQGQLGPWQSKWKQHCQPRRVEL